MNKPNTAHLPIFLAAFLCCLNGNAFGSDTELLITPSPSSRQMLQLAASESVQDTDVSPQRALTAILLRKGTSQTLRLWDFAANKVVRNISIPGSIKVGAIVWHPHGEGLFAVQHQGDDWQIVRLANEATRWDPIPIYHSVVPLRRMIISRQKFEASHLSRNRKSIEYRLYFGAQAASGKWEMRTIRESGEGDYVLAGPAPAPMPLADQNWPESKGQQFTLPSVLPSSFHSSGVTMLIQDEAGCFAEMHYVGDDWSEPASLQWNGASLCGGSLTYTPNGTGFLHWIKNQPGLTFLNRKTHEQILVAGEITFISTPSSAADGKGVVGVTQVAGAQQLEYIPVDVPLGDVLNAWMFVEQRNELDAYIGNGGVLRPANYEDQLYRLYDEENYSGCGSFPKRPYLITTDLFWENFGAAFEATFILNERYQAIPAFTELVAGSNRFFKQQKASHRLANVFEVAARILVPTTPVSPEAALEADAVLAGISSRPAKRLGEDVSLSQFKPRGHYTKTETARRYFSAMRYLTSIHLKDDEAKIIATLPAFVQQQARQWIAAYRPFISAPRAPVAWPGVSIPLATHLKKPSSQPSLFPLSWSEDNEVFYNTTSHQDEAESLGDSPRLMPSGLDLAFVFGSDFAKRALADELAKYPRLADRLDKLRREMGSNKDASLYDTWISSLSTQWDSKVAEVGSDKLLALDISSKDLWSAKRLQTGLASWATLRHTTILVNDQSAAEGGQGGFSFEPLVFPPPRGYVEPDPATFQTIGELYGKLVFTLNVVAANWPKDKATQELRTGLLAQLSKSRLVVLSFGNMATKLVQGKTLSDAEYKMIENVGGAVEHDFLLMKSTQNEDGALSIPDPVSKIADVAQAPAAGLSLEVAVGSPMEWDQIVPFFGKRELVRGAVYSYYEFASSKPLTDEEWREQEFRAARPAWLQPFFINSQLGCQNIQK